MSRFDSGNGFRRRVIRQTNMAYYIYPTICIYVQILSRNFLKGRYVKLNVFGEYKHLQNYSISYQRNDVWRLDIE